MADDVTGLSPAARAERRSAAGAAVIVAVVMALLGGSAAWAASITPVYNGDFPDPYVTRATDGR